MSAFRLFADGPALSVSALFRAYLTYLEGQAKTGAMSAEHVANRRRDLASFEKLTGDREIAACRQYDLTEWVAANPQWVSVHTRRHALSSVLAAFNWAVEEELIERSPYRRPRSLRNNHAKPRRPAALDEYLALIRGGSRPLRHALFFLWHTGARTCEMRHILWENIRFDSVPHIILERHKTAGKTGKARLIALNPVVAKFLAWLMRDSKSKHVFVNCDGTPWDRHSFARHLRRTAERLGLNGKVGDRVTAYCLRHSFVCAAMEAGFTSKEVADQVGHRDTNMVERVYGSATSSHLEYLSRIAAEIRRKR